MNWNWIWKTQGCACHPYEPGEARYLLNVAGLFRGEVRVKPATESGQWIEARIYGPGSRGEDDYSGMATGRQEGDRPWDEKLAMRYVEADIHQKLQEAHMYGSASLCEIGRSLRHASDPREPDDNKTEDEPEVSHITVADLAKPTPKGHVWVGGNDLRCDDQHAGSIEPRRGDRYHPSSPQYFLAFVAGSMIPVGCYDSVREAQAAVVKAHVSGTSARWCHVLRRRSTKHRDGMVPATLADLARRLDLCHRWHAAWLHRGDGTWNLRGISIAGFYPLWDDALEASHDFRGVWDNEKKVLLPCREERP